MRKRYTSLQKRYAKTLLRYTERYTIEDIPLRLERYVEQCIEDKYYIEAIILLEQDFQENIKLFFDKNSSLKISLFINFAYLLNIISEENYNSYMKFKKIRDLMAHKLLKNIKSNRKYIRNLYKKWENDIKNFQTLRYKIYEELLKNYLKYVTKFELTTENKFLSLIISIAIFETREKIGKEENSDFGKHVFNYMKEFIKINERIKN